MEFGKNRSLLNGHVVVVVAVIVVIVVGHDADDDDRGQRYKGLYQPHPPHRFWSAITDFLRVFRRKPEF
jgi:hypothetical protein